jgi:hypothetical protein
VGWFLLLNSAAGLAGYALARFRFRQPAGWPRTLAAAMLAWAWITLGVEILGPLGQLGRGPLTLWSVAGLALGLVRPRSSLAFFAPPAPTDSQRLGWGPEAMLAVALVLWGATLLSLRSLLGPVKVVSDAPIYHLYYAARWWKTGRIFLIPAPFGESAAPYFPAGGDLWFTWLMVAWGGDRWAKVGQAPFLLLAAGTVWAMARCLHIGASAAVVTTCWFLASTPLLLFSFEANVDTIFVAGYLLACYFLPRYALGGGQGRTLTLAALAAGAAWGTKPTALVFVPVLLALGGVVVARRHASWRVRFKHWLILALVPFLLVGFWYGRNAWLTGNPLYPLHIEAFGRVWLTGWYGPEAMQRSPYYLPGSDWRALIDILLAVLDPRMAPLWLLAVAGAWRVGGRARPRDGWVWVASALVILNVALYWAVIPYRTQQRFMLQALGLAALPLGRLLDRSRAWRVLAVSLLALHMLTPQGWPAVDPHAKAPPWDLSPRIPNAVPAVIPLPMTRGPWVGVWSSSRTALSVLMVLGLGVGSGVVAWTWARVSWRPSPRRWLVAALASLALALGAGAAIYPWGSPAWALFYDPNFPDYSRGWLALERLAGPAGARVAYAGTDLPYFLMGKGLRNEVRYVNVDAHRDWLLHDYHREVVAAGHPTWPDPRPGWDRLGPGRPDYDAWRANLRAERIQFLVVTRANPDEGPHNLADTEGFPIERQWADAHPETFTLVYPVAERDPLFRIYRVRPGS